MYPRQAPLIECKYFHIEGMGQSALLSQSPIRYARLKQIGVNLKHQCIQINAGYGHNYATIYLQSGNDGVNKLLIWSSILLRTTLCSSDCTSSNITLTELTKHNECAMHINAVRHQQTSSNYRSNACRNAILTVQVAI